MNYSKLNELAAKAMGWRHTGLNPMDLIRPAWLKDVDVHDFARYVDDWDPASCVDDAFMLLEKVTGNNYTIERVEGSVWVHAHITDSQSNEKPLCIAITLCSLTAAGIPESEITAAME